MFPIGLYLISFAKIKDDGFQFSCFKHEPRHSFVENNPNRNF